VATWPSTGCPASSRPDGNSNRAIAELLVITVGTVKSYTSQIYSKLGVSSRTQAVAQAREIGLIP
jgi:LuxR family maltose regulon positive regulatory protein